MAGASRKIEDESELSGAQKAAILLVALPQDAAALVLKRLEPGLIEEVSREIAHISQVSSAVRAKVVSEFYGVLLSRQYMNVGGLRLARALLAKTMPPDEAKRVISAIELQVHRQPFGFLEKTGTETLLTFLANEHPQTIALVLSHLTPSMAAEILLGLDTERQVEVVMRIANMDQTSPEVVREVEAGLEKRLAGLVAERFERVGGVRSVAELLNFAGRAAERQIMEGLSEQRPELVEEIRRLMFVFRDVIRVDDRGIQAILKEVANDELAMALKTASDELKEKIFRNMSSRAAELIQEEMEFMGPVRLSDVEAAQQKIVDIVRRLEESGEIIIAGRGGEKDMVV